VDAAWRVYVGTDIYLGAYENPEPNSVFISTKVPFKKDTVYVRAITEHAQAPKYLKLDI